MPNSEAKPYTKRLKATMSQKLRDPLQSTDIVGSWYDRNGTTALALSC